MKLLLMSMEMLMVQSHPVRVRGLKPLSVIALISIYVAPRAGAWIETPTLAVKAFFEDVAPRAGAWIETDSKAVAAKKGYQSHPVRVRGLKHPQSIACIRCPAVAPRAGAWIETWKWSLNNSTFFMSHPVRVRGLKHPYSSRSDCCFCRTPCGCVD